MKDNSDILNAARSHVQELMKNNDPSHDWHHVERVYKNALHLYETEKASNDGLELDLLVIQLAALFHDVVDFKYEHSKSKSLDEIAHERLSDFFNKFQSVCTNEQKEKIIYIIMNISWRKELEAGNKQIITHELRIVRDADRLDAIGAVGVARCMAFSAAKMRPFFIEELKPIHEMTAEEYNRQTIKNQSTAINHFYEKLLLIKDKMQTETGKNLAKQRHDFMQLYLNQFDREIKIE